MKKYKILGFICAIVLFLGLSGCSENNEKTYKPTAVFHLEGGIFAESTRDVRYEYNIKEDETTLIYDPSQNADGEDESRLSFSGMHVEGWYKTRSESNGTVTYTDKWDFATDRMTYEGVELYAKWEKDLLFTFDLYYLEDGEKVALGSYTTQAGRKFNDYRRYSNREGYTLIGMYDTDGNLIGSNFTHPGGDEDVSIGIECRYVEGDYEIVRTASDLLTATRSNIYLMNDIDMEGEKLSFANYSHILEGNGYRIYNFELYYDAANNALDYDEDGVARNTLNLSLFGNMENATVRNVTFEYNLDDRITNSRIKYVNYYALASSIKTSTITNVSIKADIKPQFNSTVELVNINSNSYYSTIDSESLANMKDVLYDIKCDVTYNV